MGVAALQHEKFILKTTQKLMLVPDINANNPASGLLYRITSGILLVATDHHTCRVKDGCITFGPRRR